MRYTELFSHLLLCNRKVVGVILQSSSFATYVKYRMKETHATMWVICITYHSKNFTFFAEFVDK